MSAPQHTGDSDTTRAIDALYSLSPDMPHEQWLRACMGAHAAGLTREQVQDWSATGSDYNAKSFSNTWRSIKPGGGIGAGTLFDMAIKDGGYAAGKSKPRTKPTQAPKKAVERPPKPIPGMSASEVWGRCEAATHQHAYIVAKAACGVPLDNLRVVPAGDSLRIMGESMAGALVVPGYGSEGLQTLQFITTGEVAKRLGKANKPNLPGAPMSGAHFVVGDLVPGARVAVCEGVGTAWALWQETGHPAVSCFGWGNVGKVAAALRERDAAVELLLVPDKGKEAAADEIALDVGATVLYMPEGEADNFDANDLRQRDGSDALAALLDSAREPAQPQLPLSVVFADELGDTYTPPDELVEGVLTAGDGSVLYGDSNSGKTFLMIDMACAIGRGVPWLGRRTEQGLVVYLAAESPSSVRSRLQAYQRHHGVVVPNFAIVQSPIDLFDGDGDTDKVIQMVHQLEKQRGQKVRLIVGDTLARLSAGANENAGADMGIVIKHFDRIRLECKAHFTLIHHSGKSAAAGARGWSGIKGAIETELEVTEASTGRCCEITKQRDLGTKGERIGFKLESVALGVSKWGTAATSCIVVAADAPDRAKGKRMGEVEGAVVEFLATHKVGIRKAEVAKHFDGRYGGPNVHRAIRALVKAEAIHEAAGMVVIATAAK